MEELEQNEMRDLDGKGPSGDEEKLAQVVTYMQAHWPSQVKPEWQVSLKEYPEILKQVVADLTFEKTQNRQLIRIAGLSGSGKTTQILPAVEEYCKVREFKPVLVAAREFVKYHPHVSEIKNEYGEENLRKNTDEFSTIMMFMVMNALTKAGYDIILDVTLLDPIVEGILLQMLETGEYNAMLLMIATSPEVTEHFLGGRSWRHSAETEKEFIRATNEALVFYADKAPELRLILWSVYDLEPIYDGKIAGALEIFKEYSEKTDLPIPNDDERRKAKIEYLKNI